ncbi:MAG: hypothetical protein WC401_05705 [Bacteroidales bacterium]|jgi:hypothetical protein|nr:hypothetical protein [Bacteroidales bacterium]
MKKIPGTFIVFIVLMGFMACKNTKQSLQTSEDSKEITPKTIMTARPLVIIYKTKNDYYEKVPVTLSADKESIVSYPDIMDVFYQGELAYPTHLLNGYLLDNRGINEKSVFTKYTYEEYSRLEKTPSPETLLGMIEDDDPFVEMYRIDCVRDTAYINKIISEGFVGKSQKLK